MRKVLLAIFFFILPSLIPVHAEVINRFSSTISIKDTSAIDVKETVVYNFEEEVRHGIFRDIPLTKTNQEGKKYALDIIVDSVVDENGTPYTWKKEVTGDSLRIRIGDPDSTVTGIKTYQISYSVNGAITYFSDHDELYWNVTGNDWNVPITLADSQITLPKIVDNDSLRILCYTGANGSTDQNCSTDVRNGVATIETNKSLLNQQGITAVFSFPIGIVAEREPKEIVPMEQNPWIMLPLMFISFLWYIILPVWIGYRWWLYGRDPKPTIGQASVWFDPPKTKKYRKLTPGETGTLVDEKVDLADLAATIVDLARRGYLTIIEDKKEYILSKNQSLPKEILQPFEKTLFNGIFETKDIINIKEADFTTTVAKTKNDLYESVVREGMFDKNPETTRTLYIVFGMLGFFTGNILLFLSCLIFGNNMPKKTPFGADQTAIARALKKFLASQEKFLAFQAEKMAMFEKLLPYAVAFGVEKLWAKRFSNLAMSQPDWYVSSTPNFQTVMFVNGLSSSLNTFRSSATPTKSSSGFSSGFSGGSSGGGGGGGGGGSW